MRDWKTSRDRKGPVTKDNPVTKDHNDDPRSSAKQADCRIAVCWPVDALVGFLVQPLTQFFSGLEERDPFGGH